MKKVILTGDRPTGTLHLGHYFGSLKNRVELQNDFETFIIIADWQVLYDHLDDEKGQTIEKNIREVLLGNIAAGLDPEKVHFFVQSEVPELAELTLLFQFLVTIARAKRNPTVKDEMKIQKQEIWDKILINEIDCQKITQKGISDEDAKKYAAQEVEEMFFNQISCGFLTFPISQAADILLFKADLVPVGEDQLPHLEMTREIARKFNSMFGDTFPVPKPKISKVSRLRGIDGNAKMSKSLGNVINLNSTPEEIEKIVKKAPSGENCALFEYDALIDPTVTVKKLNKMTKNGEIRFGEYKPALAAKINAFLAPFHARRKKFESKDDEYLREILDRGRDAARTRAKTTMTEVKTKMKMNYKF